MSMLSLQDALLVFVREGSLVCILKDPPWALQSTDELRPNGSCCAIVDVFVCTVSLFCQVRNMKVLKFL